MKTNENRCPSIHEFLSGLKLSKTRRLPPFESRISGRFRFCRKSTLFQSTEFFSRGCQGHQWVWHQRRHSLFACDMKKGRFLHVPATFVKLLNKLYPAVFLQFQISAKFPISIRWSLTNFRFRPVTFRRISILFIRFWSRSLSSGLNSTLTNLPTTFINMKIHYARTMF